LVLIYPRGNPYQLVCEEFRDFIRCYCHIPENVFSLDFEGIVITCCERALVNDEVTPASLGFANLSFEALHRRILNVLSSKLHVKNIVLSNSEHERGTIGSILIGYGSWCIVCEAVNRAYQSHNINIVNRCIAKVTELISRFNDESQILSSYVHH